MTCSPEAVIWNALLLEWGMTLLQVEMNDAWLHGQQTWGTRNTCLLYTSDAADE